MAKKAFSIFKLEFQSPIHIGDRRPNDYGATESFVRSDTMMAAIMAVQAMIGQSIPDDGRIGYSISSLYPYTTSQSQTVYFFPKILKPFNFSGDAVTFAKKLKKLEWLDLTYFEKQLNNIEIKEFGKDNDDLQGKFCTSFSIDEDFLSKQVSQRVTIPRLRNSKNDPTPFYMERLYLKKGSGFFFLFSGTDQQRKEVANVLKVLGLEGLGTDRTVGNGTFISSEDEIKIEIPNESLYSTNLSLLCPATIQEWAEWLNIKDDWNTPNPNVAFQLIKRGGWITSTHRNTFRKRSVYMAQEGGIFHIPSKKGSAGNPAIDLTPEDEWVQNEIGHKIWRNGNSILLPVKI